jgi:hypothetical protein
MLSDDELAIRSSSVSSEHTGSRRSAPNSKFGQGIQCRERGLTALTQVPHVADAWPSGPKK